MYRRPQFGGTIIVTIEHDEHRVAARLTQCQTDGLLELGLLDQLTA